MESLKIRRPLTPVPLSPEGITAALEFPMP